MAFFFFFAVVVIQGKLRRLAEAGGAVLECLEPSLLLEDLPGGTA